LRLAEDVAEEFCDDNLLYFKLPQGADNMKSLKTVFVGLSILLGISATATASLAQSKILRADGTMQAHSAVILMTVLGKIYQREIGVSLQINTGQALTRSVLKFGTGDLDLLHMVPVVMPWLKNGSRMYKKNLQKQAKKAYAATRTLFGFPSSAIHIITYKDSGIKSLADIKGKVIYMGPPAGGFFNQVNSYINSVTGLDARKKDFKAVRLPWDQGMQAMLDGQLDVFFRPTAIGSAVINQIGAKQEFYLLGAGKAADTKKWNDVMIKRLRNENTTIPAGTYKSQLGGDVRTTAANDFFLVPTNMDNDLAYKMVKTMWENVDEIHRSAPVLKTLSFKRPFAGINHPLHPGAVKYYKEKGVNIPADLMP
jgi:TRAP transporter TAXI family solute receptor